MRKIEEDILAADLTRHHIPVEVRKESNLNNADETKTWVTLLRDEFTGLKAWLSGPDGQSGLLADIKEDLGKLERGQKQIEDQLSCIVTAHIRDKAELEARIVEVRNDIDSVGTIARDARTDIKDHCESSEGLRRFRWEQAFGVGGVVVAIAGVFFGMIWGSG